MANPLGMSFEPGVDQTGPTLTPVQQAIQILALRLPKRRPIGEAGAGISPLVGAEPGPPTGAASPSAVVQSILRTLLGPQAGAVPVQAAAATLAPTMAPGRPQGPQGAFGGVQPSSYSPPTMGPSPPPLVPGISQPSSYMPPGGIRPPVVIPGAPPPRPPVFIPAAPPEPPPPSVTAPSLRELPAPMKPQINLEDLLETLINRRQPGRMA